MNKLTKRILLLLITPLLLLQAACSDKPSDSTVSISAPSVTTTPAPAASPTNSAPARPAVADSTAKGVTFAASSNPIKVCDGSGLGTTSLHWRAPGIKDVEIHVNTPDGPLLARGHEEGKGQTQKWVTNGTVFYLQDMSDTDKTTPARTIGTLTVRLTTEGCP